MTARQPSKEEKLARALRDNLRRRKQAVRARPAGENDDTPRKADEEE